MVDVDEAEKVEGTGTITHEEAIKRIEEATRKIPTKVVRTQADIDDFYEYAFSEESSNETQNYDEDLTNQNDSGETEEDADEV